MTDRSSVTSLPRYLSQRNYLCRNLRLAASSAIELRRSPRQPERPGLARGLLYLSAMYRPRTDLELTLDRYDEISDELKRLYGDDFELLAGTHHARFLPADTPIHVISRIFQGRHLLRPERALNRIVAGVIGRAQRTYPEVKLFAHAFLSTHVHLMLQGPPCDVVSFIGFIKREISRRWGAYPGINWPGTMWHDYLATALPTLQSQVVCLKYILSQAVKEGLVAKAQLWPGVHAAKQLLAGSALTT